MAEGVTKIQDRPEATFALVKCNNFGLASAGPEDGLCQRLRIKTDQCIHALFKPAKKALIPDQPIFDNFRQPR